MRHRVIARVVAEQHGVAMIAQELAKNELTAQSVVDWLNTLRLRREIAVRCNAAKIASQVEQPKYRERTRNQDISPASTYFNFKYDEDDQVIDR